jgi:hypothetical protein
LPPSLTADGEPRLAPDPRETSDITVPSRPSPPSTGFWIAAVLLAIGAAIFFPPRPKPPHGVAFDEPLKVGFVLNGKQNFGHRILIRLADFLAGSPNRASVFYSAHRPGPCRA